jgi:Zinc knuckle
MARTVDQNQAENKAFYSSQHPPASALHATTTSAFCPVLSVAKPGHSHPANPRKPCSNGPRERSKSEINHSLLCYRCKQTGHFGKDCPNLFDVREMTVDELQEILELRLAQLDVAPTEEAASIETKYF